MLPASTSTVADLDDLLLSFSPLAHKVAASIQRREEDHDDLYQEGMMGLLETLRRYSRRGKQIQNEKGFASTILRRSMLRYYIPQQQKNKNTVYVRFEESADRATWGRRHGRVFRYDCDPANLIVNAEADHEESNIFQFVFNEMFFSEFEKLFGNNLRQRGVDTGKIRENGRKNRSCSCQTTPCNPRIVVEDLIRPRIEVRRFAAENSLKRKRSESDEQWQERVNQAIPLVNVTKTHVRHFHGLTVHMFFVNYMKKLNDFVREYHSRQLCMN